MIGVLMGLRAFKGWLWAVFTCLALLLGPVSTVSAANPTPEQLRDQFDAAQREIAKILRDIEVTQGRFLATYDCPPSETKKQDSDDLNLISRRINAVAAQLGGRGRRPGIAEQNEALGTAGEGQGLDRYAQDRDSANDTLTVPESMIQQALRDINRARANLGRARQDLSSRPKTDRECNARFDPIATISWSPGTGDPGAQINSVVSATTRSGKAVTITAVTANVASVSTGGANIGGMGAAVNVGFKIDDVKRQGPHTLTITVTGRPAGMPATAGTTTSTHRVTGYKVNNVAPTVTTLPTGPEKDPGEELSFDGQLVVVDRNADNMNANELTAGKITFQGHPPELDTNPGNAFQTNAQARKQGAHDPTTGSYTFDITRKANAKKPHKHGKFPVTLKIEDKEGKSVVTAPIDITIKNVAPVCTLKVAPKRKYHSDENKDVFLTGTVKDENGKDDIEKIEVDATAAGGAKYTKAAGTLALDDDGDMGFTFKTAPESFKHTTKRGTWAISAFVEDNGAPEQGQNKPEKGSCNKDIEIGNDPPKGSGIGFIYDIKPGDQRVICPNELFRAGAIFIDPELDPLDVKVEIGQMNGGNFVPVGGGLPATNDSGGNTYAADLRAPAVPGTYIIRFTAVEKNQKPPLSATQQIELVVSPCPGDEIAMTDPPMTAPPAEDEDKQEPPALCGTATVQQNQQMAGWPIGVWDWLQPTSPADAADAAQPTTVATETVLVNSQEVDQSGVAHAGQTLPDQLGPKLESQNAPVQLEDMRFGYSGTDDWKLSLGMRYSNEETVVVEMGPLIDLPKVTVGSKPPQGNKPFEFFADLEVPIPGADDVLDAERLGLKLDSCLDGYDGTWGDTKDAWNTVPSCQGVDSALQRVGDTSVFSSPSIGFLLGANGAAPSPNPLATDNIFTDGFESGNTSAWTSDPSSPRPTNRTSNGDSSFPFSGTSSPSPSLDGVRLNFGLDTSFTGQDVLRTRLETSGQFGFVENSLCRQVLERGSVPKAAAHFREPAPSVEDFIGNPDGQRSWDPQIDGAQPRIGELNEDGSNLPDLLNQHAPGYRCGAPLELMLADSACNVSKTTISPAK